MEQKVENDHFSNLMEDKHSLYSSNGANRFLNVNEEDISNQFQIGNEIDVKCKDTFEKSNATSQFKSKSSVNSEILRNFLKIFKKTLLFLVLYVLLLNCGFVKARPNLEVNGIESGEHEMVRSLC